MSPNRTTPKIVAIVPAAGEGRRMRLAQGRRREKLFLPLGSQPILAHTLRRLADCPAIDAIVVVAHPKRVAHVKRWLTRQPTLSKVTCVIPGGPTRMASVGHGVACVDGDTDLVVIHDAARPLVSPPLIQRVITAAARHGGAILAVPVKPTIKTVHLHREISATLDRSVLWEAQTPQVFRRDWLVQAYQRCRDATMQRCTDDAQLVEQAGYPVQIVMGSYENLKITTPEDLIMAEALLKRRGA